MIDPRPFLTTLWLKLRSLFRWPLIASAHISPYNHHIAARHRQLLEMSSQTDGILAAAAVALESNESKQPGRFERKLNSASEYLKRSLACFQAYHEFQPTNTAMQQTSLSRKLSTPRFHLGSAILYRASSADGRQPAPPLLLHSTSYGQSIHS